MKKLPISVIAFLFNAAILLAQSNLQIPISNADLGKFPYFKTLPNFTARNGSDSVTDQVNRVFLFDGKEIFTVDGKVSSQKLNVYDDNKERPSEFQITQEFDKIIQTLGGKKIFEGVIPDDRLTKFANSDAVSLCGKHQLVQYAWSGIVEYVIKTPDKEVWVQIVPSNIGSNYYTLLVVEKETKLLTANTNKTNLILQDLEKKAKTTINMSFATDSATVLTQSKDEILNIVGIFQAHPDWKLKMEIHNAPIGKTDYTLALTQKRAEAIKKELLGLGVKSATLEVVGMGDSKPLTPNETEAARLKNTRVEVIKL